MLTMAVYDLLNGAIFNDLERPIAPFLTLNISETYDIQK